MLKLPVLLVVLSICDLLVVVTEANLNYDIVRPNTVFIENKYTHKQRLKFQLNNAQIKETASFDQILVIKTDNNLNVTIMAMDEVDNVTEYQLFWNMSQANGDREMCFNIGYENSAWWSTYTEFGQTTPMSNQRRSFKQSLTTGDCRNNKNICGVLETFFLNSDGFAFYVDKKAPLFMRRDSRGNDPWLCFSVASNFPYRSRELAGELYDRQFSVYLAVSANSKASYQYLTNKYLPKASDKPDPLLISKPIWSTFARFGKDVNDDKLWKYAREIKQYGFPISMIELDDRWEPHYGDWAFDKKKFTNTFTFADIKEMGFKVGLWIHPFINADSDQFKVPRNRDRYFLKRRNNDIASVNWWDGGGAIIDFTNKEAADWYYKQLDTLRNQSNIDTFTCWGGELYYLGGDYQFSDYDSRDYPNQFTTNYIETCAKFGGLTSVTSSYNSQASGRFVRMHDKNPVWEADNNGLGSIIPTALSMSMAGYPFVMSEMIGGTGGNKPDEELYIRWMQASTLMPGMQFSHAPWEYSAKTIEIAKKMLELREQFVPKMLEIAGLGDDNKTTSTPTEATSSATSSATSPATTSATKASTTAATTVVTTAATTVVTTTTGKPPFEMEEYEEVVFAMAGNDTTPAGYQPIMRPMWWATPEDRQSYNISDQFMVGDDLIVAPVLIKGALRRSVYLPKGVWKDAKGGAFSGPITLMFEAPLDVLPYFVRSG